MKKRKYFITKVVTASSLTDAIKLEKKTEIEGISLVKEPEPAEVNTHAIGFHYQPPVDNDYDD